MVEALKKNPSSLTLRGDIKVQVLLRGNTDYWVDIFIYDYISEKKLQQKLKLTLLTMLDIMLRTRDDLKIVNFSKYSKSKQTIYADLLDRQTIYDECKKKMVYEYFH